jgi:hypothetical protein
MNVLYGELWAKCSHDMVSFVIMHLLDGTEDIDPWCVLILQGVQTEDEVIRKIQLECSGVSRLKQCYIETLPFATPDELPPKVTLVACF